MSEKDVLFADNKILSTLLKKPLQDDLSFFRKITPQIDVGEYQWVPISIRDAVESIRNNPNCAEQIVWAIILQERQGSPGSFLELIDLLWEQSMYHAYLLTTYALCFIKHEGNIYAAEVELLLYWTNILQASPFIETIIATRYTSCWTPRLCNAICNYYWQRAADPGSLPVDQKHFVEQGMLCAEDLRTRDFANERGYYWEILFEWLQNSETAATKLGRYATYAKPLTFTESNGNTKSEWLCPRCRELYIKQVLNKEGPKYESLIEYVARKGADDCSWMLKHQNLYPKEQVELQRLLEYFCDLLNNETDYKIKKIYEED